MKSGQQPSKPLEMSIGEINEQRDRFQLAPGTTSSSEELPLLEKQALVDEILRGMPIRHIDCYEKSEPGGKVYMVTKGWPQLSAIFDFLDSKFATWTAEEKRQWEQRK